MTPAVRSSRSAYDVYEDVFWGEIRVTRSEECPSGCKGGDFPAAEP